MTSGPRGRAGALGPVLRHLQRAAARSMALAAAVAATRHERATRLDVPLLKAIEAETDKVL